MDAETWMNAHKAVELGFADGILEREEAEAEDIEAPEVSAMYSKAAVTNSLMERIAAKCRIQKADESCTGATDVTEDSVGNGRSADEVRERLNFIRKFI